MRYRAVAVASERSNAVGTVELECTPHGLFIAYLGVGAFTVGYAPAALTTGTGLTVPWESIDDARVEGDQVFVTFDHKLTPLNRLLLMHFATGRALPPEELARRRLVVRIAAVSGALAAVLIVSAALLRGSPEVGAFGAIAVAMLAAGALVSVGLFVDRNMAQSGDEQQTLAAFSMELMHYLPNLSRVPRAAEPPPKLPDISELQGLIPRTTIAIVITLTAGALAVLLVARWVTVNEGAVARVSTRLLEPPSQAAATTPREPPGPASPIAESAPRPPAKRPVAPASGSAVLGNPCRCERADSLLWAEPIPRLTLLILSQRVRQGRGADENRSKRYLELDLAIVNNSADSMNEVSLLVLFYERERGATERTQVDNRPLFFEGPLLPGQAIKWTVEARGTEFEVENPIQGHIGLSGEDAAPVGRVAELLSAKNRPVRLHGAMLLAFLGDARAREGALALREALREDEAPYLTRLLQAVAPVQICQIQVVGDGSTRSMSGCLHNSTKERKSDLGIKVRGLDGAIDRHSPVAQPPTVLVESTFRVTGDLEPDSGRALQLTLDVADKSPATFEAFADEYHLVASQ